ncbi:MAG: hypothetical protein D6803_04810 [Anaerolineae bacterium]|nr:MAG: hypothetical protein D6803_04810 [Anaerolineae bacterium]
MNDKFLHFVRNWGDDKRSSLTDASPVVLNVLVNLIVLLGDYRMYHLVYTQTGLVWQALFATIPSALGFIVWWDMAWAYRFANTVQRGIALAMSAASLTLAGYAWKMDYLVSIQGQDIRLNVPMFFTAVTYLTLAFVVAGVLYVYADDRISATRRMARKSANYELVQHQVTLANGVLHNLADVFQQRQRLGEAFGDEVVDEVLAHLGNKSTSASATLVTNGNGKAPVGEASGRRDHR